MLSTEKIIEIADQHSTPLYILDKGYIRRRGYTLLCYES